MKSPLFAFLVVVLAAILTLSGCATTEAYTGPDYRSPIVTDQPYTHWNTTLDPRQPFWETHHVLRFENPLYKSVAFEVTCRNNFFHVDVPARTVSRLLLVREDGGSCDIKRVR